MIGVFIRLFSGIAVFLYGLKMMSMGAENLVVNVKAEKVSNFVKNPICGAITGGLVAGVTQSSVVVSFITVGLVDLGVVSFMSTAPIIMGANVGTTVTAQIISLSGIGGAIIGAISSIIGLLAGFFKNKYAKGISETAFGLGFIFVGLSIMDSEISMLTEFLWFKNVFLIKSPFVLFLNGLVMTAIVQSSSAITGITIILAGKGLVSFKSAVFITLGSNVGSCFSVIFASMNKSLPAKRASVFNLLFNLLGAIIFFPFALIFDNFVFNLFMNNAIDVKRAIANFHTLFNLFCALLFLPFYKLLTKLVAYLVSDPMPISKENTINKTFTSKSRRFY